MKFSLYLDRTPFYAESGGQVADKGTISNEAFVADVKDVQKAPNGQNLHTAIIRSGELTRMLLSLRSVIKKQES